VHLEEQGFAKCAASPKTLKRRLETSPTTSLVCEMNGKVVAVLYMQLIPSVDTVFEEDHMDISSYHTPGGHVIQLIALIVSPTVSSLGVGSELRSFALHLARLDPNVDTVVGVTRCRNFAGYEGTMEDYMKDHVGGKITDPVVDFHTSYGAKYVSLVKNVRPEDTKNNGVGVLIQYNVNNLASAPTRAGSTPRSMRPSPRSSSSARSWGSWVITWTEMTLTVAYLIMSWTPWN